MAKYDLYPDGEGFLLDVQTDLLEGLKTRIVIPMLPLHQAPIPAGRLNPVFHLNGQPYVLETQYLASVPTHALRKSQDNLLRHADEISSALDMLFLGF